MKRIKRGIVLVGPPAAGKSTVGKIIAERLLGVFLDQDDFISDLKSSPKSLVGPEMEAKSITMLIDETRKLFEAGEIVVAATSISRSQDMQIVLERLPQQFEVILLFCPHYEAIRRNANRPISKRVPEDYVLKSCNFFSTKNFDAMSVCLYNTLELSTSNVVNEIMDANGDE